MHLRTEFTRFARPGLTFPVRWVQGVKTGRAFCFTHMKVGHEKPVDRVAARVIQKAPWWAKPPPEVRQKIEEKMETLTLEQMVDVFKEPPPGVIDLRGTKPCPCCGIVIVGYSRSKQLFKGPVRANGSRESGGRLHWWYVWNGKGFHTVEPKKHVNYAKRGLRCGSQDEDHSDR
jgi:hypothetical protein